MTSYRRTSTPRRQVFPSIPSIVSLQNNDTTVSSGESDSYLEVSPCNTSLSVDIQDLKAQNEKLVEHVYTLKSKLYITESRFKSERERSDFYIKENVDIKETLSMKNSEIMDLTAGNMDKASEIKRLRENSKTQSEVIINLNSEIKSLKDIAADLEGKLGQLQKNTESKSILDQLNDQKQELKTTMTEIVSLNKRIEELSDKLVDKEKEKINLQSDIAKNRSEINELKTIFSSFQTSYEMDKQEEKESRARTEAERKKKEEKTEIFQQKTLEGLRAIQAHQSHDPTTISPLTSDIKLPQEQSSPPNSKRAITLSQSGQHSFFLQPPWKTPARNRRSKQYFGYQKR